MRRACKVTLKFATTRKRQALVALLCRYRAAVNFYIKSLWQTPGKLDAKTLARLTATPLTARYKSQALKQALEIVTSTKKAIKVTGKQATCPVFKGAAVLDAKFVSVEEGCGSFDLVIRLSSLVAGQRIVFPTRRTAVLNKWLARSGAVLKQGCALTEDAIVLWVELPDSLTKAEGRVLGVDVGVNKLLSDSNGNHYGREFKTIRDKIVRSKPKSKARYRHYAERENYIGRTINRLPWATLSVIGVERLHDMKRGKGKKRNKAFRKAVAPWLYRRVLTRIEHRAEVDRVQLVRVDPANTSRTCPLCGRCDKLNRRGESFLCVGCGHRSDADSIGAQNVFVRTCATIGSLESPIQQRGV